MGKKIDIEIGFTSGRLKVINSAGYKTKLVEKRVYLWNCICSCGKPTIIGTDELVSGSRRSCGCLRSTRNGILNNPRTIRLYKIWRQMKQRCQNPKHIGFKNYGAKGIGVCEHWLVFENFLEDMGASYVDNYSIERADNSRGYEPSNCSWIEKKYQSSNTSRVVKLTFNGETLNMKQWSEKTGIPYWTLFARVRKNHWPIEKALTQAVR